MAAAVEPAARYSVSTPPPAEDDARSVEEDVARADAAYLAQHRDDAEAPTPVVRRDPHTRHNEDDVDESANVEDGEVAFKPGVFMAELCLNLVPLLCVPILVCAHGFTAARNRWFWGANRQVYWQWLLSLCFVAQFVLFFGFRDTDQVFTVELLLGSGAYLMRALTIGAKYAYFSTPEYRATMCRPLTRFETLSKMLLSAVGWKSPSARLLAYELKRAVNIGLHDETYAHKQPMRFSPVHTGYCTQTHRTVDTAAVDLARLVAYRQFGRPARHVWKWCIVVGGVMTLIPWGRSLDGGGGVNLVLLLMFSVLELFSLMPTAGFLVMGVVDYQRRRGALRELSFALQRGIPLCLEDEDNPMIDLAYNNHRSLVQSASVWADVSAPVKARTLPKPPSAAAIVPAGGGGADAVMSPSSVQPLHPEAKDTVLAMRPDALAAVDGSPVPSDPHGLLTINDGRPYNYTKLPLDYCTRTPMHLDVSASPENLVAWMRTRALVLRFARPYNQRIQTYTAFFGVVLGLLVLYLVAVAVTKRRSDSTVLTLSIVLVIEAVLAALLLSMVVQATAANQQQVLQHELLLDAKLRAQRRLLKLRGKQAQDAVMVQRVKLAVDFIDSANANLEFDMEQRQERVCLLPASYALLWSMLSLSATGPLLVLNELLGFSTFG